MDINKDKTNSTAPAVAPQPGDPQPFTGTIQLGAAPALTDGYIFNLIGRLYTDLKYVGDLLEHTRNEVVALRKEIATHDPYKRP